LQVSGGRFLRGGGICPVFVGRASVEGYHQKQSRARRDVQRIVMWSEEVR